MLRLFDFECPSGHSFEELVQPSDEQANCPVCGHSASRVISAPAVKLDGTDPGFAGEYAKWERKRNRQIAWEKSRSYYKGP